MEKCADSTYRIGGKIMDYSSNYRIDANFRWLKSHVKTTEELCLSECGIERCAPDKFFGPIIREDYHVHFIFHGKGTLKINGQSFHLHRGQIFMLPPDTEVFYYADPEDPWHYAWITFAGTRAGLFLEKAGLSQECPVRDACIDPEEFLAIIEKILNVHELTIVNELTRTSLLYEAIALLISSWNQKPDREKKTETYDYSPEIYVNSALEYIHKHYNHIRVSDVASCIGISRYYLTHIFKDKMHVSPQEYIVRYRMEQSSRLLCTTSLSVQDIAKKAGYENPLTFSKIFKNYYGLSPKNYRTKALEETSHNPQGGEP